MLELFNENVRSIETYIMFRIKQAAAQLKDELEAKNRPPIFLSMGAPVQAPPKFVIDTLKDALDDDGIHTYSTPKGENYFCEAVSQRMKNRFNVDIDAKKEVHSLIGSKEGLANFIRAICTPQNKEKDKDIVLIPDPGYASYKEMLKTSGAKAYSVPLTKENNFMPDLDEVMTNLENDGFDPKKVKALIINYPSNPLGAVCDIDYLKSAVKFCKKHKICLISDAAYCDLYFDEKDKPHSVLEIDGAKETAVEFFSFSKPYAMTGWRLGWICGNHEAVGAFAKLKSTIDTGLFKALQYAGAKVLNSDEGENYIKKSRSDFKNKQMIMVKGFRELGWEIRDEDIPKAAFYLWLPIPKQYKSSEEFCSALLEKSGIVAVPGIGFGDRGEGFFRVSAVASDEKLYEVISRMKEDGFYYK